MNIVGSLVASKCRVYFAITYVILCNTWHVKFGFNNKSLYIKHNSGLQNILTSKTKKKIIR